MHSSVKSSSESVFAVERSFKQLILVLVQKDENLVVSRRKKTPLKVFLGLPIVILNLHKKHFSCFAFSTRTASSATSQPSPKREKKKSSVEISKFHPNYESKMYINLFANKTALHSKIFLNTKNGKKQSCAISSEDKREWRDRIESCNFFISFYSRLKAIATASALKQCDVHVCSRRLHFSTPSPA